LATKLLATNSSLELNVILVRQMEGKDIIAEFTYCYLLTVTIPFAMNPWRKWTPQLT
jgi:hypothetical protein